MDRTGHKKYIPVCPKYIAPVDQYMWDVKDTNVYQCMNGVSKPIYNSAGEISPTLPLHEYPRLNEIHPEVRAMQHLSLNYRQPYRFIRRNGKLYPDV